MSEETLTGRIILAVEDEYFLADELDRDLKAAGAAVLGPVSSIAAALELLTNGTPDAAVLDMNLGGEMAHPVADALVARNVPFLLITGYYQTALPERFSTVRRLEKPVETRAIIRELSRLLSS